MSGEFSFRLITIGLIIGVVGYYVIEGIKVYRD